jgi:hypothetical protein
MEEVIMLFRERGDQYVDQCDALYAYLVEPFICLSDPRLKVREHVGIPEPSFLKEESPPPTEDLPSALFDL